LEPEDDDLSDEERREHCVEVTAILEGENKTSFFSEKGDPTDFGDVDKGDEASVLGRFMRDEEHEDLIFEAKVVQLGQPLSVDGILDTEVTEVAGNDQFLMEIDEGQGITTDDGEGKGSVESIDRSDLMFGDRVNIYGVEGETDCFAATTVISFGDDESVPLPSGATEASSAFDAAAFAPMRRRPKRIPPMRLRVKSKSTTSGET
jgi:hypothetical protein